MHILNQGETSGAQKLELISYRILGKPYSKWRAILAETGESDTAFLIGLKELHGIQFDFKTDPMLYISQDTQQMRCFEENGVANPTLMQLLLTAKAFSFSEGGCKDRIEQILKTMQTEEVMS